MKNRITNWHSFARIIPFCLLFFFSFRPNAQAQDRDTFAKDPVFFIQTASKTMAWTEPTEPTHIVGPVYYVGTKGLASYLITSRAGHILLYTGMPGSGPMIENSINKLGFKVTDIKYILTGHAHCDQVGGHAYLQKISGAKVAMMAEEKDLLESGGKLDFQYGAYPEFWFDPVHVDTVLHSGNIIELGNNTMSALLTPGHTKGSTTWIINVMDEGKFYTIVFPDGTTLNPGYRIRKDPSYPGIEDNYYSTLYTLETLRPNIWLSSHTDFFDFENKRQRAMTEGVKAWIDPDGYKARIAGERKKFEAEIFSELGMPDKN